MIELRDYQKQAVDELYDKFQRMLCSSENEICVFKAPTGSGKTIVVASLLRRLVTENNRDVISFIWIAPRKLHDQSKDKLEKIYHDQILKCSNFDDLQNKKIEQNEILFFNWESINKMNNIFIMDNENDKNLTTIVQNTKDDGHKLILIIDESHYAATGDKALEIINDLSPDITLEVSATPHLDQTDEICKVRIADVKKEEMIKNEILINPKFSRIKVGKLDSDEIIIKEALKQRKRLKKEFERENSNVNPLLLIQVPDKKSLMEDKRDTVVNTLKKHNITENNDKLAIWLSEEKSDTLPNIEELDNCVEVLIFKQAISIGWDCPRASILALFRDYTSFEFTIQTIGRIMRMPELKYYPNSPKLNNGYIFTNLENINLTQEYIKGYVTQYNSYRKKSIYTPIKLESVYIKRQREITRLSGNFIKIFNRSSITKPLKSQIKKTPERIIKPLISDGRISNIDKTGMIKIHSRLNVKTTEKQILYRFNDFIRSACKPFAAYDSSDRLKNALYKFLESEFNIKKYSTDAQRVILSSKNYKPFWNAISKAKDLYTAQTIRNAVKEKNIDVTLKWEVPKIMSFSDAESMDKSKSIMKPFYFSKMSNPEKKFIECLNKSTKVKWWYKNGESEKKYFAVPYTDENGYNRGFYVDFIIQFKDRSMGLFDTKEGQTASSAGPKHDGIYKYLKDKKKNKKLFGGILIEINDTWKYYTQKTYHFDEKNTSDWTILEL